MVASLDSQLALRALCNGKAPPEPGELFVGRGTELALLDRDLDVVEAGGASLRILVGEPGSGKTMLMQAMANRARSRRFVTSSADLDPDTLLHGRGGEGRALLRKIVLGLRTAATGDAPALGSIVSRFGNDCRSEAEGREELPRDCIRAKLGGLHGEPKGTDFAKAIESLALAREESALATSAQRWLCGNYSTVGEARDELGIGSIIEDQHFWPMQKLWSLFVRQAGRPGLVLFLDEARVLCDLHNPNARALNLEQLLMMINDIIQGRAQGIAVVIAATPAFVTQWNGMAKHEGLSSCLLHQKEQADLQPGNDNILVHLQDLADDELAEMLRRCRHLYAACRPAARPLPDEALATFLETCRNQIGSARWHVPRIVLQRFIRLLERLSANLNLEWHELLSRQDNESDQSDMEFEGYAHRQM